MTLIEDYLHVVALLLPKDKRDDIVEELRELILSRIEAREGELGRTLTDDETEEVLRQIGHPLVVASRYRDDPQYLVGPAIYPYWIFAVKAAVTLQVAVTAVVFLVRTVTGDAARAGQAISSGITGALILIGLATVAAWMIDRRSLRVEPVRKWRVRDLRFLSFVAWNTDSVAAWWDAHRGDSAPPEPRRDGRADDRPTPFTQPFSPEGTSPMTPSAADPYYWGKRGRNRDERRKRRAYGDWRRTSVGSGLGGVAAGMVLLLWWVGAIHFGIAGGEEDFRSLGLEPGALATFDWVALKALLYLPVLVYVGLVVAQGAVRIAHPDAIRMQGLLDLAIAALVIATVCWLWAFSPLASAVRVETLAALAQRMRELFENSPPFPMGPALTLVLVIVGFGGVIRAVRGFWEVVVPAPFIPPPYRAA